MTHSALVTGAEGFAGRHLCDLLMEHGWRVRSCVYEGAHDPAWQRVCDIRRRDQVEQLFAWAGPCTHVFHLAAMTFIPETMHRPEDTFDANVIGTIHLLSATRAFAPNARFINVGSAGAYGPPQSLPVTEAHPLNPEEPYSISKAAADQYCAFAHRAFGADVIRARPFNHAGPGQNDRFVLPAFAKQIAEIEAGRRAPVLDVGNLDAARDFLHVKDVVRAYELLALKGTPGAAYNICRGTSARIREALDVLLSLSRAKIEVRVEASRLRPVDIMDVYGSHERITADTGWQPEISLESLLHELLEDFRRRTAPGAQ